jgi:diguanylate cyclase (GGDEF)-like protein
MLVNRATLLAQLKQADSGASPAVLFLNLDRFEVINDSLGRLAGGRVLDVVASRLQDSVRPTDFVARLDADQFVILLPRAGGADHARAVAERIAERLREPLPVDEHEVSLTASIGIAICARDLAPEEVLRNADIAMCQAKQDGKDRHEVFDVGMRARAWEHMRLETDLHHAIKRDEFRLHYQPLVSLATSRVVGVEALLRWQHPRRGLVPPTSFIPLAEKSGLIVPVGRWVLKEAFDQARIWNDMSPGEAPLSISVNVSARQIERSDELVVSVREILEQSGLPADQVKLEITESAVMRNPELAIATLWALKGLGVHLVVDDFGTGYSSLAYLKRFPVDTLKIDRSFVEGLAHQQEDQAIVAAIVAFSQTMGLDTVAEGIETEDQAVVLRQMGCTLGQGYLFGRPKPAEFLRVESVARAA